MAATKRWHRLPSGILHGERPRWRCCVCGAVFFSDQGREYVNHVTAHPEEETRVRSPRVQAPGLFDPDAGDADWAQWVRHHQATDPHGWKRWLKTDDGKHSSGVGDGG